MSELDLTKAELKIITPSEVRALQFDPVDPVAREQAAAIIKEVKEGGYDALLNVAVRLRDIESITSKVIYNRSDLKIAFDSLDETSRNVLISTAARIKTFATAQRNALSDLRMPIPGGEVGHWIAPVEVAGCYAPGGRYPLPSSVLMTVLTAKAAGVKNIICASPRPAAATLAAAYVAEADILLAIGGAQAIAAMAYGIGPIQVCIYIYIYIYVYTSICMCIHTCIILSMITYKLSI